MSYLQKLGFQGRRLRLAWEEIRRCVDQEDDPLPDLEDAEERAWDQWENWAITEGFCPLCCGENPDQGTISTQRCTNPACPP